MFIKKIILDGFKSYSTRVEVSGFDSSFNAITGFNGSGKSNILDAICFVLGLSKLETARCRSLNELIYKSGQSSVKEASVTIEIDNSDGKFQMAEYRQSSTIVVRRLINVKNQSKYYIGGFTVTREKLLDFFQSVSLNIQNPHFLIMQGKIIKVVSSKPEEILSMVVEAVGIAVYETKKKQNMNKIDKYDVQLAEIERVIKESISPKLAQLKEEEKSLFDFENVNHELEKCLKIYTAFQYLKDKDIVDNADSIIREKEEFIQSKQEENSQIKNEYDHISEQMKDLQDRLNEEIGGDLKELETDYNEKKATLEKMNTNQKLKMDSIKEESDKIDSIKSSYTKVKKKLDQKQKDYEKAKDKLESLKEEHVNSEMRMKQAEKDFESVTFGLSKGRDGEAGITLAQQVISAKDQLATIDSNLNKAKLLIHDYQQELTKKKQRIKSDQDSYERINGDIKTKEREIAAIESELERIGFDEERYNHVKNRLTQIKTERRPLTDELHGLQSKVIGAKFNYTKPYANFDEEDVYGVVCNLFTVKSEEYSLAIERSIGGRMFNVVVANEEVGKALINNGNLRERRTFLPLNKIQGREADKSVKSAAERLVGKGNVDFAINMVSYDSTLTNAMKHVFGDTLICPNMNMAKKVAYAPGIMKRVVTYDGEVFDPAGTLTGGSLKQQAQTLAAIAQIRYVQDELERLRIEYQQMEDELRDMNQSHKQYEENKSKLNLKRHEITILQQSLQESNHYVQLQEINELEEKVKEEETCREKFSTEKTAITAQITELEEKINNSEAIRERERKEVQLALDSTKKAFESNTKKLQKEQQNFDCVEQEIKYHEDQLANLQSQLDVLQNNVDLMNKDIDVINTQIETASHEVVEAEKKCKDYKKALSAKSNEIKNLQKSLDLLKSRKDENDREIKVKQHEMEQVHITIKEAKNGLNILLKKNSWISKDEKHFRDAESEYRVLNENFNELEFRNKITTLKSKKAVLAKSVNMKANIMQGQKQQEFDELLKKQQIIIQDRGKLINYITTVEKEKDAEIKKACDKINGYFGQIFSTLLPGSNARLVPVNTQNIQEGLEIKVAFGNVWKDSLSELSGGQRSLMALSLVLALLKFNPAPLYILDEVDAALDQSHTQNIGMMIKKYFKGAQFIIVSLKEDMFSNANVIFQTKFIDGRSSVERIKSSC